MNALQQQLRQLATDSDFIAQFLQEGAYVFPQQSSLADSTDSAEEQQTSVHPAYGLQTAVRPETAVEGNKFARGETAQIAQPQENIPAVPATSAAQNKTQQPSTAWQNKVVVLLPPEPAIKEVQFLHKVLAAVGIPDEQVWVQEKYFQAKSLGQFEGSRIVLSFGAVTDFQADYQLRSKSITVIMADKLLEIEADIEAKKKLWGAMKSFFK